MQTTISPVPCHSSELQQSEMENDPIRKMTTKVVSLHETRVLRVSSPDVKSNERVDPD